MTIENHAKVSKQIRAQGMVSTAVGTLNNAKQIATEKFFYYFLFVLPFFSSLWNSRWCCLDALLALVSSRILPKVHSIMMS